MINLYRKKSRIEEKGEKRKEMEFVVGIIVGAILHYVFGARKKPSGTFVIDLTDPAKDVCRLEMDDNLNDIYSKRQITLNVRVYEE